ncbi:MAG: YHYH protein, partial [Cytophagales bacterium]|nr:YHYH protein [Cytophagales bacterium]
ITRMKSSFTLRNITVRNQLYTGTSVTSGPGVNASYPLGYFKEDYQYTAPTSPDYLDYHNGRFCITPEYPNGIYCYFTTVDKNWNSAYPYAVGPTFYGVYSNAKFTGSISDSVTTYTPTTALTAEEAAKVSFTIAPNPASDMIAVQINEINRENIKIELYDLLGRLVQSTTLFQGSTMAYFDTRTLYAGEYIVRISGSNLATSKRVTVID